MRGYPQMNSERLRRRPDVGIGGAHPKKSRICNGKAAAKVPVLMMPANQAEAEAVCQAEQTGSAS